MIIRFFRAMVRITKVLGIGKKFPNNPVFFFEGVSYIIQFNSLKPGMMCCRAQEFFLKLGNMIRAVHSKADG